MCSFSDASPVPSHYLGSALADAHVLLHALPFHKWSVFICVGGVVGKPAGPLQWALRALITGPVLQLSGEGGLVWMANIPKVSARRCAIHSAAQRVSQNHSPALGSKPKQHIVQGVRGRCDLRPASCLHL